MSPRTRSKSELFEYAEVKLWTIEDIAGEGASWMGPTNGPHIACSQPFIAGYVPAALSASKSQSGHRGTTGES